MLRIQKNDPPTLDRPSQWSREFSAFIAACLKKDPFKRADTTELLEVGNRALRQQDRLEIRRASVNLEG